MKNTFGNNITVTLFGESHGEAIGAVIDGIAPGIDIDREYILDILQRRRPNLATDTKRREKDDYKIVSGVFNGKTTGTPICIIIPNDDVKSGDYDVLSTVARPSHADYSANCKYHGFQDYRGGGHFSGRLTAALVAAGAIAQGALKGLGIKIGTHVLYCGGVQDRDFEDLESDFERLSKAAFPTLDAQKGREMTDKIINAKFDGDSLGGVVQGVIYGVPAGVGEPWFDSVEGVLSHALFSIGGIKGVEFGLGFGFAEVTGSEANDPFEAVDGKIMTKTNNNGGINGGITNGMPIIFNCAVKPTPSISKEQQTVDFSKNENTSLKINGRHDPAIIRRICPVIDAVSALVICDLLATRFGTDVFTKGF